MSQQPETRTAHKSHYSAFAAGPAAVLIWHERVSVEGVQSLAGVFATLRETHSDKGFGLLTIIEEGADVNTPPAARKAMSKALSDNERWLRGAAIAYEADGFKATILRSAVTAINLMCGARFPNRVFRDNREAFQWLGEKLQFSELQRHPRLQAYVRPQLRA
jgi:hypothetical protein